jgi:hypothetical protein
LDINNPPAFVIWKVKGPDSNGGLVPLPQSVQSTAEPNVPNGGEERFPPAANPVVIEPATNEKALLTLNANAGAGGGVPAKTIPAARVSVTWTVFASTWCNTTVPNGPEPQQELKLSVNIRSALAVGVITANPSATNARKVFKNYYPRHG